MNWNQPEEPTSEQCSNREQVGENLYACYYPQMGGYGSKCVIQLIPDEEREDTCFEAWIWHDGDFPYTDSDPVRLHHCSAEQFIRFGHFVLGLNKA